MRPEAVERSSSATSASEKLRNARVTRVVIIDDHPMLCSGLAATIVSIPDFEVVGIGGTADEAIEIAERLLPDLMIVDINMPGNGLSAISSIAYRFPVVKVVVLSMLDDHYHVQKAFRAGASGYLTKGVSATDLISTVRAVLRGECSFPAGMAAGLLALSQNSDDGKVVALDEAALLKLTEREAQILGGVAQGQSNKEIAVSLGLAEQTVKNYLSNVLRKLHVRSRVEAAMIGARRLT